MSADQLARIRADNMRNAALRHDWVYRLRTVFDTLGVPPTVAMRERETRLAALAAMAPRTSAGIERSASAFAPLR